MCHAQGWRTNCSYCHGGTDNNGGAPPADIDGATDSNLQTVGAHTEHVAGSTHLAYDCTACHRDVTTLLTPGHMFDNTPGISEVDLSLGLSPNGSYATPGCNNLYCHGNGQSNSSIADFTSIITACDTCHPFMQSSENDWDTMSGRHTKHMKSNIDCYECHGTVLDSNNQVQNADLHVNGTIENDYPTSDVVYQNGRCDGSCHGDTHNNNW